MNKRQRKKQQVGEFKRLGFDVVYLFPEDQARVQALVDALDHDIKEHGELEAIHFKWGPDVCRSYSLITRIGSPATSDDQDWIRNWFTDYGIPHLLGPFFDTRRARIVKVSPYSMMGIDGPTRQLNALLTDTFVCSEAPDTECLDYALWLSLVAQQLPDHLDNLARSLLHSQFATVTDWNGNHREIIVPNVDVESVIPQIHDILLGVQETQ